jgi:hypothetical protein
MCMQVQLENNHSILLETKEKQGEQPKADDLVEI